LSSGWLGIAFAFLHYRATKENMPMLNSKEGQTMKTYLALLMLLATTQWGCQFLAGTATGALATGAGYEIQAKRQMDKLNDDYREERISRREYETRKQQIEKGSIIY
jgi:hypothetical protein